MMIDLVKNNLYRYSLDIYSVSLEQEEESGTSSSTGSSAAVCPGCWIDIVECYHTELVLYHTRYLVLSHCTRITFFFHVKTGEDKTHSRHTLAV